MLDLRKYLDSTYLKTNNQSGLSEEENKKIAIKFIKEAISENFKLIMIRPDRVALSRELIDEAKSNVLVGTVIGFHEGTNSITAKLDEARQAIEDGADELDFVVNFEAFKNGNSEIIKKEIFELSKICLDNDKVAKFIIEVAALTNEQIAGICDMIKRTAVTYFEEKYLQKIFVKSSTGFYKTTEGKPSGATFEAIKIMAKNSKPLPIKAAGGVKTMQDAIAMIELGVSRIGTSSALKLISNIDTKTGY